MKGLFILLFSIVMAGEMTVDGSLTVADTLIVSNRDVITTIDSLQQQINSFLEVIAQLEMRIAQLECQNTGVIPDGYCDCFFHTLDECGVCNGDTTTCQDCAGVPNGDSLQDMCGYCDNDSSNDCLQDCNDEWGGTAIEDVCGMCGGDATSEEECGNILKFESGDYVTTNSFSINGDISISVTASLFSGSSGVLYWQVNGGEINLSYENNQIRFGVKASSCGSASGWHNIYVDVDSDFHNFIGVYSRYGQYLRLYQDYALIGELNISGTSLASCSVYDAGFGYNTNGTLFIKEISIWHNVSLSSEQIGSSLDNIEEDVTPTNSWDFNNTNESTLYDTIGDNHGSIHGATWVERE